MSLLQPRSAQRPKFTLDNGRTRTGLRQSSSGVDDRWRICFSVSSHAAIIWVGELRVGVGVRDIVRISKLLKMTRQKKTNSKCYNILI